MKRNQNHAHFRERWRFLRIPDHQWYQPPPGYFVGQWHAQNLWMFWRVNFPVIMSRDSKFWFMLFTFWFVCFKSFEFWSGTSACFSSSAFVPSVMFLRVRRIDSAQARGLNRVRGRRKCGPIAVIVSASSLVKNNRVVIVRKSWAVEEFWGL